MNKLVQAIISGAVLLAAMAFINMRIVNLGNWSIIILCFFYLALGIFFHYKLLRHFASLVRKGDTDNYPHRGGISLIRIEFEKDCFRQNYRIIGYTFLAWFVLLFLIYIVPAIVSWIKPGLSFNFVSENWYVACSFFLMPVLFHYTWNSAVKIPFSATGWRLPENEDEFRESAEEGNIPFSSIEILNAKNECEPFIEDNKNVNDSTEINDIITTKIINFSKRYPLYKQYWKKSYWKIELNTGSEEWLSLHKNYEVPIGKFRIPGQTVLEYINAKNKAGENPVLKLRITRDDRNDHLISQSIT